MSIWDDYYARLARKGSTKREVILNREKAFLSRKLSSSLAYQQAVINGQSYNVAILDTDNLEEKMIYFISGEDVVCGSTVEWMKSHWLIYEMDANQEVYTRAKMIQCNYLLKWITEEKEIIERWCVVSDGTKYLTGETISSYNDNGTSLGDTRISLMIGMDEYTVKLGRNHRFLVDVDGSGKVLAYRLTKPFKVGGVYNNQGAMSFVLAEANTEDVDNLELHIADYYKYFPEEHPEYRHHDRHHGDRDRRKVWL